MAEREGFEPSVPFPAHVLSRDAQSAALSPLRADTAEQKGDGGMGQLHSRGKGRLCPRFVFRLLIRAFGGWDTAACFGYTGLFFFRRY